MTLTKILHYIALTIGVLVWLVLGGGLLFGIVTAIGLHVWFVLVFFALLGCAAYAGYWFENREWW